MTVENDFISIQWFSVNTCEQVLATDLVPFFGKWSKFIHLFDEKSKCHNQKL